MMACPVEYTECISADGYDSTKKFPENDTEKSDGGAPVMQELWGM